MSGGESGYPYVIDTPATTRYPSVTTRICTFGGNEDDLLGPHREYKRKRNGRRLCLGCQGRGVGKRETARCQRTGAEERLGAVTRGPLDNAADSLAELEQRTAAVEGDAEYQAMIAETRSGGLFVQGTLRDSIFRTIP